MSQHPDPAIQSRRSPGDRPPRGRPRRGRGAATTAVLVAVLTASAAAQSPAGAITSLADDESIQLRPHEAVENYLARHDLLEVLAAHLRDRVAHTIGEARIRNAELLGRLYVRMLERPDVTPQLRQAIETQSQDLLSAVPQADSFELRLNLAKASYLRAEVIVENERLRNATAEEKQEAERVLRSVGPLFANIALNVGRRVDQLERREQLGRDEDIESLRSELAEARRLRSLANYYAGWSEYYIGWLSGVPSHAGKAKEYFGVLLNAVPGRQASLDRLPRGLLRYEHVARAVIGCALASSLAGDDVEAVRWLEAIEQGESIPETVLNDFFQRQVTVYAAANRWADVELVTRRQRTGDRGGAEQPLDVLAARLVAIVSLEASRNPDLRAGLKTQAEKLAQIALGDLVARGAIPQVLSLVRRYGTAPIGEKGFVVNYVRALKAYEDAREADLASGGDSKSPAKSAAVINQFEESARLLKGALASDDLSNFKDEAARAEIRLGLALFYAGKLEEAARRFESAAGRTKVPTERKDALWYALTALDHLVIGGSRDLIDMRDRLALLFIREFPQSEEAYRLLLRQTNTELVGEDQAVEMLLGVPESSSLYRAARVAAARILYSLYRSSRGERREFAAIRFADVAEPVLVELQRQAVEGRGEEASKAAQDAVMTARRIMDALLVTSSPDLARVEKALAAIELIGKIHGMDLAQLRGELVFRRLQIAIARNDQTLIDRSIDELRGVEGPFADIAHRMLFSRAAQQWSVSPTDEQLARRVVRHGQQVLQTLPSPGVGEDPAAAGVRESVAAAAAEIWRTSGDALMRDLALEIDRSRLDAGIRTAASLRRVARLSEAAGGISQALDAWRELFAGLAPGTADWFEARYESLRLLARTDPAVAREVIDQHKLLYPEYGPDPYGELLRDLDRQIPAAAPAPAEGGTP